MACSTPYPKYPRCWRKASRLIRFKLARGCCQWCGKESSTLSVHHVGAPYPDGRPGDPRDKHDLRLENLVALCFECHDGVEHIGKIRDKQKRRKARRRARTAAHRALGIGTGLQVCSPVVRSLIVYQFPRQAAICFVLSEYSLLVCVELIAEPCLLPLIVDEAPALCVSAARLVVA